MSLTNRRRDERVDGVSLDTIVDPGKGALEVPIELWSVVILVLNASKFLDEVELDFDRDPRRKLKGDVLVGVGAAVSAVAGNDADRSGFIDP
ncbi:MAG: hypothetical protein MUF13_05370 [Akkermansiaceae bacterium]|nr:hypothetical protein [Akkermansiaceae bacterium]